MLDFLDVISQSAIRIEENGKIIYVDPFELVRPTHDADYIFLTHDHYDHFSPEDIRKILTGRTVIVAPQKMGPSLKVFGLPDDQIRLVRPNERLQFPTFSVTTVASYNTNKSFHPKSNGWVGYLFAFDSETIYVAGDTDITPEAKNVRCDIAMIPIGGTFTMTPEEAAELINIIRPRYAIPTHYGSIVGAPEDGKRFASQVGSQTHVVRKLY